VVGPDVTYKMLAQKTESYSGSDLKHLCVSAALDSVKEVVQVPWATTSTPAVAAAGQLTCGEGQKAAEPAPSASAAEPSAEAPEATTASRSPAATSESEAVSPVSPAPTPATPSAAVEEPAPVTPNSAPHVRTLHLRNFLKALREITPSSSEALGSLADLRKWNEEFGEGRRDRKRTQVWGRGRFGFIDERAMKKAGDGPSAGPASSSPSSPPA